MDSCVVTSAWKQFGERVERAVKDKLILDRNEIHPLKTTIWRALANRSLFNPTRGILELHSAEYSSHADTTCHASVLAGTIQHRNKSVSV